MRQRRAVAVLGLALLAPLGLTGCGKPAASPAAAAPAARQPAVQQTPAPRASATPSPAATPRSTAELTRALLTLDDVPTGLSLSKDDGDDGSAGASSTRAGCAALVRLMNADRSPGSVNGADAGFDGGSDGPFLGETLESFRPGGARTAVAQVRAAVRSCDELQMDPDGSGPVPVTVEETSAPDLGDAAAAARFTATDDETGDEFEFDVAFVAAGDVLLGTTAAGADASDVDGFTTDAYDKLVHGRVDGGARPGGGRSDGESSDGESSDGGSGQSA